MADKHTACEADVAAFCHEPCLHVQVLRGFFLDVWASKAAPLLEELRRCGVSGPFELLGLQIQQALYQLAGCAACGACGAGGGSMVLQLAAAC